MTITSYSAPAHRGALYQMVSFRARNFFNWNPSDPRPMSIISARRELSKYIGHAPIVGVRTRKMAAATQSPSVGRARCGDHQEKKITVFLLKIWVKGEVGHPRKKLTPRGTLVAAHSSPWNGPRGATAIAQLTTVHMVAFGPQSSALAALK